MNDYLETLQDIENDHESQLLNEFYNQEDISKSLKRKKLEEIRDRYYQQRKIFKIRIKDRVND